MKRGIITITVLFLILLNTFAQSKKIDKAFEIFHAGEYFAAIDMFKTGYETTTDKEVKLKIAFCIAECYRKINDPDQASMWYGKVIAKEYNDPAAVLYYADALKMQQKYEEAKVQYQAYKDLVPGDERAQNGILSCDLALEWIEFPTGYAIEEMKFFNSKFSDYSPAFGNAEYREVYFTSCREETLGKTEHEVSGESFSDIFVSTQDRKGKWSTPVPLSEPVNTEAEEGTPCISSDYNTMYFTRCNANKRKKMGCEIFAANKTDDKWSKAESLQLSTDSIVIAHPALSPDELTLYFVSDMSGSIKNNQGENSKDIWKVTRASTSDKWGNIENLGKPVNTAGDEEFPYIHNDGTFYFSSNGHVGMGGLDIFKLVKDESVQLKVENMKYPINSSSDDFGIVFEKDREAGFLSSTRAGKRNDDLYSFMLPPLRFTLSGIVKDEKTDQTLEEATVKLIGSDGVTMEGKTGKDGDFKFLLKPGTDYVFVGSKDNYLKGKERETTKGLNQSTDFKVEIYLQPIDKPIEVENIFFEFNLASLRPESKVSLDKLVETLNDNPEITIELGSNTDARGTVEYNIELSQKRAQTVTEYLISKGINQNRLTAKGYGKSSPKEVDSKDAEAYPFLQVGTVLTEEYINSLPNEDQKEMAHFLNRRTEFRVLSTNFNE